jgi:LPS-assembly protein
VPKPVAHRLLAIAPPALLAPLALAAVCACTPAAAQSPPVDGGFSPLKLARTLAPPPEAGASGALPIVIRARELRGRPELETVAEGEAEFRRGGLVVRADRLSYTQADDLAVARGQVRISREGSVYTGPELQLKVQSFEGFFLQPEFDLARIGAGGRADRVDFIDRGHTRATNAIYTSCPRDGNSEPAWVLATRSVSFDFDANEGVAEGAVLRFLGVPILGVPALSFPLGDARKSGWLPPSVNLDNRSGLDVSVPYYWNIAPNRDATITPKLSTRRGLGVDTEFRYLEPRFEGSLGLDLLPKDETVGRTRHALRLNHEGSFGTASGRWAEPRYALRGVGVSDDDWWKDFPGAPLPFTPRLLPQQAWLERGFALAGLQARVYARAQHWQVLQVRAPDNLQDLITPPYQRSPQVGVSGQGPAPWGLELSFETELNRFTLPEVEGSSERPTGARWHAIGAVARPWREPGWWVVPRLSFNAAAYDLDQPLAEDGRRHLSRTIPSASVDAGMAFERETTAFGRRIRQILEPRLLYVHTPLREQSRYLRFDSDAKDFNFSSIFSDNAFSGVDQVSDADQLTLGATTRFVDTATGAEALRLGVVQRLLFRAQQITPDRVPFTRRVSDLLLLGSTSVIPKWTLDASVRYNADTSRTERSILAARYTPGDFRTVSATYRFTRQSSEQVELGWQWPLGRIGNAVAGAAASGSACNGRLYSVGRVNYSVVDSRITDSLVGLEYDAGCWVGRVVAERLSTGRSEATTRLLVQLELVGLSRLGSSPLRVLKDNIPGYRLLRDERNEPSGLTSYD